MDASESRKRYCPLPRLAIASSSASLYVLRPTPITEQLMPRSRFAATLARISSAFALPRLAMPSERITTRFSASGAKSADADSKARTMPSSRFVAPWQRIPPSAVSASRAASSVPQPLREKIRRVLSEHVSSVTVSPGESVASSASIARFASAMRSGVSIEPEASRRIVSRSGRCSSRPRRRPLTPTRSKWFPGRKGEAAPSR